MPVKRSNFPIERSEPMTGIKTIHISTWITYYDLHICHNAIIEIQLAVKVYNINRRTELLQVGTYRETYINSCFFPKGYAEPTECLLVRSLHTFTSLVIHMSSEKDYFLVFNF